MSDIEELKKNNLVISNDLEDLLTKEEDSIYKLKFKKVSNLNNAIDKLKVLGYSNFTEIANGIIVTDTREFTKTIMSDKDILLVNETDDINLRGLFENCHYREIDLANTKIESDYTCWMFTYCYSPIVRLNYADFSNVVDIGSMFGGSYIQEIYMDGIIHNKITDMGTIFADCMDLKYISIKNNDTSGVKYVSDMFRECIKLERIDGFSNLNMQSVESAEDREAFEDLNKIHRLFSRDWRPHGIIVDGREIVLG